MAISAAEVCFTAVSWVSAKEVVAEVWGKFLTHSSKGFLPGDDAWKTVGISIAGVQSCWGPQLLWLCNWEKTGAPWDSFEGDQLLKYLETRCSVYVKLRNCCEMRSCYLTVTFAHCSHLRKGCFMISVLLNTKKHHLAFINRHQYPWWTRCISVVGHFCPIWAIIRVRMKGGIFCYKHKKQKAASWTLPRSPMLVQDTCWWSQPSPGWKTALFCHQDLGLQTALRQGQGLALGAPLCLSKGRCSVIWDEN